MGSFVLVTWFPKHGGGWSDIVLRKPSHSAGTVGVVHDAVIPLF